jgi:processive 1,2-diacylglycerol beta-glucosyltransferase
MIQLQDKQSGSILGSISEDDLQFLIDNLEEESEDDVDYYLNHSTLEIFKEKGISSTLLNVLENALGDREDVEIEWSRAE